VEVAAEVVPFLPCPLIARDAPYNKSTLSCLLQET
jgi:hypothetical protein